MIKWTYMLPEHFHRDLILLHIWQALLAVAVLTGVY